MRNLTIPLFLVLFSLNAFSQEFSEKELIARINSTSNFVEQNPGHCIKENLKFLEISKKNNCKKCAVLALNNIAVSFGELDAQEKSLEYAIEAEKIARNIKDYPNLIDALNLQSIVYPKLHSFNEGLSMLDEALLISNEIKIKDDYNKAVGSIYLSKANLYLQDNTISSDSCIKYDQKATFYFEKIKNDSVRNIFLDAALINLGEDFLNAKKFDKAELYLNKGLKLSIENKAVYSQIYAISALGKLYFEKGDYDKSLQMQMDGLNKAKESGQVKMLRGFYSDIAEIYEKKGDNLNAKNYLSLYRNINDSLISIESKELSKILNSIIEKKSVHFKDDIKSTNKILAFTVLFCAIIVIVSIILYSKFKKEKQERIKNEKVFNERMDDFKIDENKRKSFEEVINFAIQNNSLFLEKFKNIFPEFIEKLLKIAPSLNKTDLQFCALLKLGFATKEIATYTNTSVRSVEAKKYRLRKKLNIPVEDVISSWMINF